MSLFGCVSWRRTISRAMDGREGGASLAALSAHLLACSSCRGYAEGLEEDVLRLERALSPLSSPGWIAEGVGLPATEPPGLLPGWAPSALVFSLGMALLGSLVLASGPFALLMGALPYVSPEPADLLPPALLLLTLFGGVLLLASRRELEARLAQVLPTGIPAVPAVSAAGSALLAGGGFILVSYLDVTCRVWNLSLPL